MQEIADYSLQWPLQLLNYYWQSGDMEFLREMYPVAKGILDYFSKYKRKDGLLENVREKRNLVDWPENLRDDYDFDLSELVGEGCHNVINAFYCGAVKTVNEIGKILGLEPVENYSAIIKAFYTAFYRRDLKLFADSEVSEHTSLHVHKVLEQLNRSFITPIDREDIYYIAKELDNITDSIEATAHRFLMFHVKEVREEAKKLSTMVKQCAEALQRVMQEMKSMKTSKTLTGYIIEVNRIEDEGDRVFRKAISDLFSDEPNSLEVIKWMEIFDYLENTLDACEDVANIIEGVVMKHA